MVLSKAVEVNALAACDFSVCALNSYLHKASFSWSVFIV